MVETVKLTPQQSLTLNAYQRLQKAKQRVEVLERDYQAYLNRLKPEEVAEIVKLTE